MSRHVEKKRGFTLIELLVVVAIIAILAAIVLRVTIYVHNKLGRGKAVNELSQIKNALAEFYSVYGQYPPTTNMEYETVGTPVSELPVSPTNMNYTYGLVYYLCGPDPNKARWSHFLQGVMPNTPPDLPGYSSFVPGFGSVAWSNSWCSCWDPWRQEYRYESFAPHQSYRLWSSGPTVSTNDDVGVAWDE